MRKGSYSGIRHVCSVHIPYAHKLDEGTLALAQLHGQEDESCIRELKTYTDKPIIKAFSIKTAEDIEKALQSPADYILRKFSVRVLCVGRTFSGIFKQGAEQE